MKYEVDPLPVPQDRRQEINEKLLYLIDSGRAEEYGINSNDVYNLYTGDGGLHGLKRKDYENYAAYSNAKKEVENGQFFTPPSLCRLIAEALSPAEDAMIADLTCGAGGFFNFMPREANLYGCEIDPRAYKVAKQLYPLANLENRDIRAYQPLVRFDYVVGNPPYNLRWWTEDGRETLSQFYYCRKAAELLKPFGILALIVPASFLSDDFSDGTQIKQMEEWYSFLGHAALPANAFAALGVSNYQIKLQFWQKRGGGMQAKPYHVKVDRFVTAGFDCRTEAEWISKNLLREAKTLLVQNRYTAIRELAREKELSSDFLYQVQKMLYQIKCHPGLKEKYPKCYEYFYRFCTETQPDGMEYEEWARKRLTEAKVTAYLQKVLRKQNEPPPQDRIALVKRRYDFIYKGYSNKARRQMPEEKKVPVPIYEIASSDGGDDFPGYEKLIRRKRREYIRQNQRFADMEEDAGIRTWLGGFCLWDSVNEDEIYLNDVQRHDLNLILQKQYALLQWEQGSGKTLAGIAYGLYRMEQQNLHHTWVVSTAISIRNNWDVMLKSYDIPYVIIERLSGLLEIRKGDLVLITLNQLSKYRRWIKKWVRMHGQKIALVFDESDEMTNPSSIRAKAVLDCFRRCRAKLLTTGTSTRNNISEFAPQLELLYNNSYNMLSWSPKLYHYDRGSEELRTKSNPYFGKPIPAYQEGYRLFTASHLPEKTTVFGVGQRTQDIYNADALDEILEKTVITRTFSEIVGREIRRFHQVLVTFDQAERDVYQMAMERFFEMRDRYFSSTGNSRKDAMLKLIQQITLLLRISAAPDTVAEYTGGVPTKLRKIVELVGQFEDEIVAIGVRHKVVLDSYKAALEKSFPDRRIFAVTGETTSFAQRRKLRKTLKESGNGILLCTQQSLPSSVNFEYVNRIIIPELHYNNAKMSQFYMRFVRYTSTEWKDIYFVTYAGSIESNLMQMVLAKEKINLRMKGENVDLEELYQRFGVDYDLLSLLMYREQDEDGKFHIRWGEQQIAS